MYRMLGWKTWKLQFQNSVFQPLGDRQVCRAMSVCCSDCEHDREILFHITR